MSSNPTKMDLNSLAYDAFQKMENDKINQIIVVDNEKYVGIVHIHQLLKEGCSIMKNHDQEMSFLDHLEILDGI